MNSGMTNNSKIVLVLILCCALSSHNKMVFGASTAEKIKDAKKEMITKKADLEFQIKLVLKLINFYTTNAKKVSIIIDDVFVKPGTANVMLKADSLKGDMNKINKTVEKITLAATEAGKLLNQIAGEPSSMLDKFKDQIKKEEQRSTGFGKTSILGIFKSPQTETKENIIKIIDADISIEKMIKEALPKQVAMVTEIRNVKEAKVQEATAKAEQVKIDKAATSEASGEATDSGEEEHGSDEMEADSGDTEAAGEDVEGVSD